MGALMLLTGIHNAVAATTIVRVKDPIVLAQWVAGRVSPLNGDALLPSAQHLPRIAAWKIAVAVFFHLFFAIIYVVMSAL